MSGPFRRRHFKVIANWLRAWMPLRTEQAKVTAWIEIVESVADGLASTHPKFNRGKFLDRSGYRLMQESLKEAYYSE